MSSLDDFDIASLILEAQQQQQQQQQQQEQHEQQQQQRFTRNSTPSATSARRMSMSSDPTSPGLWPRHVTSSNPNGATTATTAGSQSSSFADLLDLRRPSSDNARVPRASTASDGNQGSTLSAMLESMPHLKLPCRSTRRSMSIGASPKQMSEGGDQQQQQQQQQQQHESQAAPNVGPAPSAFADASTHRRSSLDATSSGHHRDAAAAAGHASLDTGLRASTLDRLGSGGGGNGGDAARQVNTNTNNGHHRVSNESARFGGSAVAPQSSSGRSSFAREDRASLDLVRCHSDSDPFAPGSAGWGAACDDGPEALVKSLGISGQTANRFLCLAVVPASAPIPAALLTALWSCSVADAAATLRELMSAGLVHAATLADGGVWCLPQPQHLQALHMACHAQLPRMHGRLLETYAKAAGPNILLSQIPDDGWLLANIGHHLVGAGRLDAARSLLSDPSWLVRKLAAAGSAGVVSDFRRYLAAVPDPGVKYLLESFQQAGVGDGFNDFKMGGVSSAALLRAQMAGRLTAAAPTAGLGPWLESQLAAKHSDAASATSAGRPRVLWPRSSSLEQVGGVQRLLLRGHAVAGPITCVLLAPGGVDVITASADGCARVYDMDIGDCVLEMRGHAAGITDLALTADGSRLVTAGQDCTARAWELEGGACLRVLQGHSRSVMRVVVDPAGRYAVTASCGTSCRVWDLASGACTAILLGQRLTSQIHPDSRSCLCLTPCSNFVVVGCVDDYALKVWEVASGRCVGVMSGHTDVVTDIAIASSGRIAATTSQDGTTRLWNMSTGAAGHVLGNPRLHGPLYSVCLSEDGKLVISAGAGGTVLVWETDTGKLRFELTGHDGDVTCLALSQAGGRVAAGGADGLALVWDLETGKLQRTLKGHVGPVNALALTRKGRFAVTGGEDGTERVWDFSAPERAGEPRHEGPVLVLAISEQTGYAASAGDDGVVRLWDAGTGRHLLELPGSAAASVRWLVFSTDGARLLAGAGDRAVWVWAVPSGKLLSAMPAVRGSRVKSMAPTPDLGVVVVALFDSTVTAYDTSTGAVTVVLQQRRGGRVVETTSGGHTAGVNHVLVTAVSGRRSGGGDTGSVAAAAAAGDETQQQQQQQQQHIVITLAKDATARVWSLETGACLHVLSGHEDGLVSGAVSGRRGLLATLSHDGTSRLWDLASGQSTALLHGCTGAERLALSTNGELVAAAAGTSGRVRLWTSAGGAVPLAGDEYDAADVALSADGTLLGAAGRDGSARVWSVQTGALQGVFVGDGPSTCCTFDCNSPASTLVVATDGGAVHFLAL